MELNLKPDIQEIVKQQADRLGLTEEETVRMVIGGWADSYRPKPAVTMMSQFMPQMPNLDDLIPKEEKALRTLSMRIMKKQVENGDHKCDNCTFELTWDDIMENKCHTCGAPVLEKESEKKGDTDADRS